MEGRSLQSFSRTPSSVLDCILMILAYASEPLTMDEIVERSGQLNPAVESGVRLLLSLGLVELFRGKYLLNLILKEAMGITFEN